MSKTSKRGVIEKAIKNKAGFFAILVDDQWYGTQKDDHRDKEGSEVTFEAEKDGKWWRADAVTVVASTPAKSGGGGSGGNAGDHRQKSIVLQSSYKTATEIASALLAADKLALGTKKADMVDNFVGYVNDIAIGIFNNCMDPDAFLNNMEGPGVVGASDDTDDKYNAMEA
jgi:hypothetical protein